jgi:polysaccharide biosynthesis protein PslG
LAAWSPSNEEHKVKFAADVHVTSLAGNDSALNTGEDLTLTASPVMITKIPSALVNQAKLNAAKPFPWGGDYAHSETVSCRLQADNINDGLTQINPQKTAPAEVDGVPARQMVFSGPGGKGRYALFRADPQFAPFGTSELEITAVVRRVDPDKVAGLNLDYESIQGYVGAPPWYTIPADDQWHELTWKVTAANFVGAWGYNFRLNALSSPNELYIKEVRVRKPAASQ